VRLASASVSSLRTFRSSLSALGLAALLAAFPVAAFVPLHPAFAEPAASQATVAVAQQEPSDPNQPKNPPIDTDPDDAPWPGDDEDNPPNPPNTGVQPAEPNAQPSDVPTEKATPALPDSVLKAKTLPHAGGGALDTLEFKPAGVGAKRPPLAPKPVERRPYFGLHPAVFFLGLLAGHIFLVRAING
jgi:hypothetical protein